MKRLGRNRAKRERGTAVIEWLIVMLFITFGSCVLLAPLGAYLLGYSDRIEMMTELPLP